MPLWAQSNDEYALDAQGNAISEGEQVMIGGNESYIATCRKHYYLGIGKSKREKEKALKRHEKVIHEFKNFSSIIATALLVQSVSSFAVDSDQLSVLKANLLNTFCCCLAKQRGKTLFDKLISRS